jgi:hypothetical protein
VASVTAEAASALREMFTVKGLIALKFIPPLRRAATCDAMGLFSTGCCATSENDAAISSIQPKEARKNFKFM